jgi:hypothetical protein
MKAAPRSICVPKLLVDIAIVNSREFQDWAGWLADENEYTQFLQKQAVP